MKQKLYFCFYLWSLVSFYIASVILIHFFYLNKVITLLLYLYQTHPHITLYSLVLKVSSPYLVTRSWTNLVLATLICSLYNFSASLNTLAVGFKPIRVHLGWRILPIIIFSSSVYIQTWLQGQLQTVGYLISTYDIARWSINKAVVLSFRPLP